MATTHEQSHSGRHGSDTRAESQRSPWQRHTSRVTTVAMAATHEQSYSGRHSNDTRSESQRLPWQRHTVRVTAVVMATTHGPSHSGRHGNDTRSESQRSPWQRHTVSHTGRQSPWQQHTVRVTAVATATTHEQNGVSVFGSFTTDFSDSSLRALASALTLFGLKLAPAS
uniref:Uncharacterized protein n=1 Tax=Knipowitschia caucasica TaxID=637954 RepID=A0AAV2LCI6_KNICA